MIGHMLCLLFNGHKLGWWWGEPKKRVKMGRDSGIGKKELEVVVVAEGGVGGEEKRRRWWRWRRKRWRRRRRR